MPKPSGCPVIIPVGTIFYAAAGEYEDWDVLAVCRATHDLYVRDLERTFAAQNLGSMTMQDEPKAFVLWLLERGYAERLPGMAWDIDLNVLKDGMGTLNDK